MSVIHTIIVSCHSKSLSQQFYLVLFSQSDQGFLLSKKFKGLYITLLFTKTGNLDS